MTAKWKLDPAHSQLTFRIRHLMISNVTGSFKKFDVHASTEGDDFRTASVKVDIVANSIDTNNEQRDAHLKSGDFFESQANPRLVFESTKVHEVGTGHFKLSGNLTIKQISKPVVLDVEFSGMATDPYGNEKAGFTVTGEVNRKEWGINWNAPLEKGGVLLGDELKIQGDIQLIREQVVQPG